MVVSDTLRAPQHRRHVRWISHGVKSPRIQTLLCSTPTGNRLPWQKVVHLYREAYQKDKQARVSPQVDKGDAAEGRV